MPTPDHECGTSANRTYAIELVRVRLSEPGASYRRGKQCRGPRDVAELLRKVIGDQDREHFVVFHLDGKHRVAATEIVSVGVLNGTPVHPREVFKGAVLANAAAIIVGHNHPSGDPLPSRDDREVRDRLKAAGELLGIPVLDFLIICPDGSYWAASEHG